MSLRRLRAQTSDRPAVLARSGALRDAAAIVTCHNYGRFLAQCLDSLLAQRRPFAEVVVVDDASSDDSADVAQRYADRGVRYVRGEWRDVCAARNAGLAATSAPWVAHVDADNWLGPDWLEALAQALADTSVGVAYSAPTIVREDGAPIGPSSAVRPFDYWGLRQENHVDACALVRREAIAQAGGWHRASARSVLEDWHLWLRVSACGWRFAFVPGARWCYRRHAAQASQTEFAAMCQQGRVEVMRDTFRVAVVTPFCGRDWALGRTVASWERLGWPADRLHLLAIDNACDAAFGRRLQCAIADQWASYSVVRDVGRAGEGVANAEFANRADLRRRAGGDLADAMSRLYARTALPLLGAWADLVLTLEDDIELVSDGAIPRLLECLEPGAAVAAAVVRSRFDRDAGGEPLVIAWDVDAEEPYRQHLLAEDANWPRPRPVGGTGFGCTLHRAGCWHELLPPRTSVNDDGRHLWHDVAYAADARRAGWRWLLDPTIRTRHWDASGSWV